MGKVLDSFRQGLVPAALFALAALTAAAVLATTAAPALAKSKVLHLTRTANNEEEQLEPGETITLFQFGAVVVHEGSALIECPDTTPFEDGLEGSFETNNEATDKVIMRRSLGDMAFGERCTSSSAHGPEVLVALEPNDATLELTSKLTAELKAGKEPIELVLVFLESDIGCRYSAAKFKGVDDGLEGREGQLQVKFGEQEMKREKGTSSSKCAKTVKVATPDFGVNRTEDENKIYELIRYFVE